MNLIRIKQKIAILGILLLGILACAGASVFALNETKANAQTIFNDTNATLFLPQGYEQYLELAQPSYIAVSSRHVAIADGNNLFIYDRTAGEYTCYKHNGLGNMNHKVTNVQIAETENGDRIFFSDESSRLFEFNSNASSAQDMLIHDVSCSTFLIDPSGSYLFTATSSENLFMFHRYDLSQKIAPTNGASSDTVPTTVIPRMTYHDNKLYCVIDTSTLLSYSVQKDTETEKLTQSEEFSFLNRGSAKIVGLQSVCAYNGMLYYTVNGADTTQNGIWQADFAGNATHIETGDGFSTLSVYADGLYCIKNTSVLKLAENGTCPPYPSYEISSSSNSVNRLNNAKDIVRAGSLLVTADTDNNRISVYNMQKQSFDTISVEYSPAFVATDGKIVAAAAENSIYEYTCDIDGNWEQAQMHSLDSGDNVNGIACVFGKVYYTSSTRRGVLGGTSVINTSSKGLAANLYGDLFVAYNDRKVAHFTEETFLQDNESGEEQDFKLPDAFSSLRADFEGNLYYLDDKGALCRCGEEQTLAEINASDYVYTESSPTPVSFALGYEDDEVYFLFGDFIVKTDRGALGFPSLGTISAKGVREMVFTQQDRNVAFCDVKKNSVGIRVDLGALTEDAPYFPYSSYARTDEAGENVPLRGVLLAETEGNKYSLVALYEDKGYTVQLFRKDACSEAEPSVLAGEYAERYLTSDAYIYYFPCITAAHDERLPRGTKVKIVDIVQSDPDKTDGIDLGLDFAYVEYETNARASVRGYLPLSFLTSANPNGETAEQYFLGDILPQGEGVVFTADDGTTVTLTERTQVSLFDNGDGTYFARYEKDGIVYTATVADSIVDKGESDALRIALIIILSVLALIIIGAYIYLLPRGKKKNKI